ncbi:MAG: DUF4810 domain-containing protein [Methyloceanibacter sp.]
MARVAVIALVALALCGCANQRLYEWGGYESMLYAGYKDPSKMQAMRVGLENHLAELQRSGQKVAPGLYAELGTLYLQAGASDKAIAMYARERDTWPESKGLMDTMIKSLERRGPSRTGGAK